MRRKGPDNVTMGVIVEACHKTWLFMTTSSPSCKLIPCKSGSVGSLFYTEIKHLYKVYSLQGKYVPLDIRVFIYLDIF